MDERSLQDLFSNLIPDEIEGLLAQGNQPEGEQHSRAVALLKTAAGQAGGNAGEEIEAFLNGSGALFETTRAAAAHGSSALGSSAATTVAEFLAKQLNVSPALARIIAPLLVNLLPGIGKPAGSTAAAKPKPHRKEPKSSAGSRPKKPKSSASAKPASGSKPKKPASASSKPKKPASSASSKPKKPASSTSKPKTSSSKKPTAKPKRTGRTGEIPES